MDVDTEPDQKTPRNSYAEDALDKDNDEGKAEWSSSESEEVDD